MYRKKGDVPKDREKIIKTKWVPNANANELCGAAAVISCIVWVISAIILGALIGNFEIAVNYIAGVVFVSIFFLASIFTHLQKKALTFR